MKRGIGNAVNSEESEKLNDEPLKKRQKKITLEVDSEENSEQDALTDSADELQELKKALELLQPITDPTQIKLKLYEIMHTFGIKLDDEILENIGCLLHWASSNHNYNLDVLDIIIDLCLSQGIDVDIESSNGLTPLGVAIRDNLICHAELLLSKGADIKEVKDRSDAARDLQPRSLDEILSFSRALTEAIHPGCVKEVVDHFISSWQYLFPSENPLKKALNPLSGTLLHEAIAQSVIRPNLKYIVQLYAKDNLVDIKDGAGYTPLMTAILYKNYSAVSLLLKHNADVNQVDILGVNVLQIAFDSRDNRIFALIFEKADPSSITEEMTERYDSYKAYQSSSFKALPSEKLTAHELLEFCEKYKEYELAMDPRCPIIDNSLRKERAHRWIEYHPYALQQLAGKIIENISYVDFTSFTRQLKKCTKDFNNMLHSSKSQQYLLILPELAGKSNPWVFSHALQYLSILPKDVVRIDRLAEYFDDLEEEEDPINLLFVDDASYSGTQMKYDIDAANCAAKNRAIQIHCIIPFMTKRAAELLRSHNDTFLSSFQVIASVKNIFNSEEKKTLEGYNVNSHSFKEKVTINWPEITLTYFQHKIADWKSTLTVILKTGRTIHDNQIKIPFIPLTIEPYKQDISLPIDIALALLGGKYEKGLPRSTDNDSIYGISETQKTFTPNLLQIKSRAQEEESPAKNNSDRCVLC